jgi:IS1 family transposase
MRSGSSCTRRNLPEENRDTFGFGDVWTWVAIDADTKMMLSYQIGPRTLATASDLMSDLAGRLHEPLPTHHGRPQGVYAGR